MKTEKARKYSDDEIDREIDILNSQQDDDLSR